MLRPGTHGVHLTSGVDTARRFRRNAYVLGSAAVRSRYAYDPGPTPIPPGGASAGAFAAKLGSAILASRSNRDAREQEQRAGAFAEEKAGLELQALRDKVNAPKVHYLTESGQGLDLTPEQAALYEYRNRDNKTPTPRARVTLSRDMPEIGYHAGDEVDPEELSVAGSLYRNQHPASTRGAGQRPRYGSMSSVLNAQESDLYKRVDDHVEHQMAQHRRAIEQVRDNAISGDVASMQRLRIDPKLHQQYIEKGDLGGWRALVNQAVDSTNQAYASAYRSQGLRLFKPEFDRIRAAREELGRAVGSETGIDPSDEVIQSPDTTHAIRPEVQSAIDSLKQYAPSH